MRRGLGIIARLTAIKNHSFFLRVAREVLRSGVRAKFAIIGDGELRDALENEARELRLQEDVFFLSWRRDIPAVYAGLDVVCLTSLNEGTPVTLIEAQASAKPVVATNVGGVRDIVSDGKSGYLIPSGDLQGFTHRLQELLANPPKRAQFGQAGREHVRTRFTLDRLMEDHLNLYRRLLQFH